MNKCSRQVNSGYSYYDFACMIADEYLKALKTLSRLKKIKRDDLIKAIVSREVLNLNKQQSYN